MKPWRPFTKSKLTMTSTGGLCVGDRFRIAPHKDPKVQKLYRVVSMDGNEVTIRRDYGFGLWLVAALVLALVLAGLFLAWFLLRRAA